MSSAESESEPKTPRKKRELAVRLFENFTKNCLHSLAGHEMKVSFWQRPPASRAEYPDLQMGLTVRGGVFLETNCRAVAPVGQVDCVNFACKLENIDLSFGCLTQGGKNRKLGFVSKFLGYN